MARVLRDEERDLGPGPTRFRLTLTVGADAPPASHVSTAHGLIFDDDGRIVLARHVERQWTIPGGHREAGESPLDALHREVAEEAGAVVRDPVLLAVERIERLAGPVISERYTNPAFQVFYGCRLVSLGAPTALDECTDSQLFTAAEARLAPGWVQEQRDLFEEAVRWATTS